MTNSITKQQLYEVEDLLTKATRLLEYTELDDEAGLLRNVDIFIQSKAKRLNLR